MLTPSTSELKIAEMGFLQKIKSSIFDPKFYSKIEHQSLGSALKYYFLFILALSIVNIVIIGYELGVQIPREIRSSINQAATSYPSDLEVSLDDGQVTTNATEPYFVPFPEMGEDSQYSGLNNILVIDTKTPFSSAQFNQYKTLAWLTKDSLFYNNREFDQRSLDLSEFDDITVNKAFVGDLLSKVNPWLNYLGPALILFTFIGLFIGFSFSLVYFLFLAVLIFFLSGIFKWGLNYSASYKTAIYASTLGFILDLVLLHTGVYTGFYGFPFFFTLTALCITTINLQNFDEKS